MVNANDNLERFVSNEAAQRIRTEALEQQKSINCYLDACRTIDGFVNYKLGYDGDDFVNNKVTVRVYYKTYYTDKKF